VGTGAASAKDALIPRTDSLDKAFERVLGTLTFTQADAVSSPRSLVFGEASHELCRSEVISGPEERCALDWAKGLQVASGCSRDDGEPAGHGFNHR
jgi:hypothetical protein